MAYRRGFPIFILIQLVFAEEFVQLSKSSFGHTYITRPSSSAIECCIQCLMEDECNSCVFAQFNKTCKLNNRSPADFPYTNVTETPNKDLYYLKPDPCPKPWILYNRHCYIVKVNKRTWKDSEDYCKTMGATLTDIIDIFEDSFVARITVNAARRFQYLFWIGMADYHNVASYEWTSGSPVSYVHYHADHKNVTGKCVAIGPLGRFNFILCNGEHGHVCKRWQY